MTIISFIISAIISFSALADDEQIGSFYRQRAIMLSQLELEKNLDLMSIDPETCAPGKNLQDRRRIVRTNTEALRKKGKLTHCPQVKFVGSRSIKSNLDKQKIALQNALTLQSKDKGIETSDSTKTSLNETSNEPIEEGEDNTILLADQPDAKVEGSLPSRKNLMSGYAGVPFGLNFRSDDTFRASDEAFLALTQGRSNYGYYGSKNLPPGLYFGSNYPDASLIGVPTKPGFFTPIIKVAAIGAFGGWTTIYKGPVRMEILPTPKFTVLNPLDRYTGPTSVTFQNESKPFHTVLFNSPSYSRVHALNGITSGKLYFEVKIEELGEITEVGVASTSKTKTISEQGGLKCGTSNSATYPYHINSQKTEYRKFKNGDILMVAFDSSEGKIWCGVNGDWIRSSYFNIPRPEAGTFPSGTHDQVGFATRDGVEVFRDFELAPGNEYIPFIRGHKGTKLSVNFGEKVWVTEPPKGFSGIPFKKRDNKIPNFWNSNTASGFVLVANNGGVPRINSFLNHLHLPLGFSSNQFYAPEEGGDKVFATSPKKSGRWQFELSGAGYGERARMGLAPVNFSTTNSQHLGAKGTKSIGLRRHEDFMFRTGRGVIEVDGKEHYIERFDDHARFTFDCDFDNKKIRIYGEGKLLLDTDLPDGVNEWVIAGSARNGNGISLHTYTEKTRDQDMKEGVMKFPVAGVSPWLFDSGSCSNCASSSNSGGGSEPVLLSQTKKKTCAAITVDLNGGSEKSDYNCTIPETEVGEINKCTIEAKSLPCEANNFGGYFCSYSMDDYKDAETCARECKTSPITLTRKCEASGWSRAR